MARRFAGLENWQVIDGIDLCRRELARLKGSRMDANSMQCVAFWAGLMEGLEAEAARRGIPVIENIPVV